MNVYIGAQKNDIIALVNNSEFKFDAIASKMKEIGSKEYSWKKIAKQYNDLW